MPARRRARGTGVGWRGPSGARNARLGRLCERRTARQDENTDCWAAAPSGKRRGGRCRRTARQDENTDCCAAAPSGKRRGRRWPVARFALNPRLILTAAHETHVWLAPLLPRHPTAGDAFPW